MSIRRASYHRILLAEAAPLVLRVLDASILAVDYLQTA
jgi:hypothetical protein